MTREATPAPLPTILRIDLRRPSSTPKRGSWGRFFGRPLSHHLAALMRLDGVNCSIHEATP